MFGKTEKELYEKEINELKRQNKKLMARCEIAEKYQDEYKSVSEQLKKIKKQHEKAQVLLVFYMLKMEKMAMKFQFDMLKS